MNFDKLKQGLFILSPVYRACGGFGEFVVVVCLSAAITLAFMGKLTGAFAEALTAIGGFGVIHDQLTDFQANKNQNQNQNTNVTNVTVDVPTEAPKP